MNENKEVTATGLLDVITTFLSGNSKKEEPKAEPKEEVAMEETPTEEPKEEAKFSSELPVGEYELKDGTKFTIDEDGNVVGVIPAEEEAPAEEAPAEETEMAAQIEALKAEVAKLSEVEPVSAAPQKRETIKLAITPNMTYKERVMAETLNNLN